VLATVYLALFLFAFSTRVLAFKLACFDLKSVLATVSKELEVEPNPSYLAVDHVQRCTHRHAVFSGSPLHIEVSSHGEEGIGFRPIHEFSTLFSRELTRSGPFIFRKIRAPSSPASSGCDFYIRGSNSSSSQEAQH
jgi:hypothetical protein